MHPVAQFFDAQQCEDLDVSLDVLRDLLACLQPGRPAEEEEWAFMSAPAASCTGDDQEFSAASYSSSDADGGTTSPLDADNSPLELSLPSSPQPPKPSKRSNRRKRNQELKRRMAERSLQVAQEEENSKYKTTLCAVWERLGACPAGEGCPFAHGARELRSEVENQCAVTYLAKLMGKAYKAQRQQQQQPGQGAAPAKANNSSAAKRPGPVEVPPSPTSASTPAPVPSNTPLPSPQAANPAALALPFPLSPASLARWAALPVPALPGAMCVVPPPAAPPAWGAAFKVAPVTVRAPLPPGAQLLPPPVMVLAGGPFPSLALGTPALPPTPELLAAGVTQAIIPWLLSPTFHMAAPRPPVWKSQ